MALNLLNLSTDRSIPTGLTVEVVSNIDTLKEWIGIGEAAYGGDSNSIDPDYIAFEANLGMEPHLPYRRYLGRLHGIPVAAASLFLGAGVAGLYSVATLPEVRGQGIGTELSLSPLLDAQAMGYNVAVLESSPLGQKIYLQLGFREYCRVRSYLWKPTEEPT
jgi:GNAT superfamily N-acetyltransferase